MRSAPEARDFGPPTVSSCVFVWLSVALCGFAGQGGGQGLPSVGRREQELGGRHLSVGGSGDGARGDGTDGGGRGRRSRPIGVIARLRSRCGRRFAASATPGSNYRIPLAFCPGRLAPASLACVIIPGDIGQEPIPESREIGEGPPRGGRSGWVGGR
jgi:hypothetical protein